MEVVARVAGGGATAVVRAMPTVVEAVGASEVVVGGGLTEQGAWQQAALAWESSQAVRWGRHSHRVALLARQFQRTAKEALPRPEHKSARRRPS